MSCWRLTCNHDAYGEGPAISTPIVLFSRGSQNIKSPYADLSLASGWLLGIASQQLLAMPASRPPLYGLLALLIWVCWHTRKSAWWQSRTGLRTYSVGVLAGSLLGLIWASFAADLVVSSRLDSSMNRETCSIQGSILTVDQQSVELTRFVIEVDQLTCGGEPVTQVKRARLSWYRPDAYLKPGEVWQLTTRLKRPHGFANPGLFDYSAWLAHRQIGATGYVDNGVPPRRLTAAGASIAGWRADLVKKVTDALNGDPQTPFIVALALGERGGISDQQWQLIRDSGTSHLLAISGMHIGLVGAAFWWLGSWLWRRQPHWLLWLPAPLAGVVVGWLAALVYAVVSGFAVPAQRAIIMFTVVAVGVLARREVFSRRGYLIALFLVLLWDPLAILQAGFWLSFGALLVIAWRVMGRQHPSRFVQLVELQIALWLGLMPLVLLFFDQTAVAALPANLVAIPVVTLVVLPASLIGTGLLLVSPMLAEPVLALAALSMDLLWQWLEWVTALANSWSHALADASLPPLMVTTSWGAVLSFIGILWLLAPRGFPARWLGIGLLIPALTPGGYEAVGEIRHGGFNAQVVDVGQGLAVMIFTQNRALVYDVGARFSERFDVGEDLLVPLLRRRQIQRIDRLVISHGDSDHAGGLPGLLDHVAVSRIDSGTPEQIDASIPVGVCAPGERWRWDGVLFEYLHFSSLGDQADNDRSCVLRVGGPTGLLLTGDISSATERRLMAHRSATEATAGLSARVMLVPHHGSRYSSSAAFIKAIDPTTAIVSSGYANRFDHPHPLALARYERAGVDVINTATAGAVTLDFLPSGEYEWFTERLQRPRYWH